MTLPHAKCTVVIPCYNMEQCLEAAVQSVLEQSFQDFQIVIVDDGSQDGTRGVARRLAAAEARITVVELPENRGRAFARNRGAEAACSPYLTFLDCDDTFHPNFLLLTTEVLSQMPQIDAVKVLPRISLEIDPVRYQVVSNSLATAMLIRRHAFELVGGWPESAAFRNSPYGGEDLAFLELFSFCFNTGSIGEQLYNYNYRPGNCLDKFLARTCVIDGKLVFTESSDYDYKYTKEVHHLQALLRERVRALLGECTVPSFAPLGSGAAT